MPQDLKKQMRNGLVIMATNKKKPIPKNTKPIKPAEPPKRLELEEIRNLEEPIYEPKAEGKTRGRPKNENYIPYVEAREFIHGELIPSRKKYHEWWDRNKPKAIPRYPYRVYKDWVSWNDFLGTDNEFGVRVGRQWRPMDEAITWVHSLKIESYPKWMEWCKENTLPDDIPARPDLVYNNWRTWNHWLGNRPIEALEAIREARKLAVYYIIHIPGVPENVFTFGMDPVGPTSFKERWEREKFTIIRMFWYEPEQAERVKHILESLSSPYLGDDKQRICPNFWEINYHLELTLQRITKL